MGELEQMLDAPHKKLHLPVVKGNIHNISTHYGTLQTVHRRSPLTLSFGWM